MDYADLKIDYAFKRVFGDERNKDIVIPFLNALLHRTGEKSIQTAEHLIPSFEFFNYEVVEVLCCDKRGVEYYVVMQVVPTPSFDENVLYYVSKRYAEQLEKESDPGKLRRVVFLRILDYVSLQKESYKSIHRVMDIESKEIYYEDFVFVFIEMPKFTLSLEECTTDEERWLYFMKHAAELETLPPPLAGNPAITRARECVRIGGWEVADYNRYIKRTLYAASERMWLVNAETKGEKQGKLKIAKSMLEDNFDEGTIIRLTGLSADEINDLRE